MTNGEHSAVAVAEKYTGDMPDMVKLKKLGEELVEFTEAVLTKGEKEILDEAGDMCFLILHILYKKLPPEKINLTNLCIRAADKMETRVKNGYYTRKNEREVR